MPFGKNLSISSKAYIHKSKSLSGHKQIQYFCAEFQMKSSMGRTLESRWTCMIGEAVKVTGSSRRGTLRRLFDAKSTFVWENVWK